MKKLNYFFLLLLFHSVVFSQNYTWMHGSSTSSIAGSYGTQGIAAPGNDPGGRHGAATWVDASGNLWLFGGEGYASTANISWLNDLWKYDVLTNQWTWIRGSNSANQIGTYGTQGVASSANDPGAREFAVTWKDASGNFWMFGGDGFTTNTTFGRLGDLWKYNPSTNQWTFMRGFTTLNQNGNYGTLGVSSSTNDPGARFGSGAWTDASNNLWMFGGRGFAATGPGNFLSDLWKYNISTNEWTWMKGSNVIGQAGTFGTINVSSPGNLPGSKEFPAYWQDVAGNFYMFGGRSAGYFSDLWQYNPLTNNWTWIGGPNVSNQLAVYSPQGVPSATNIPGGTYGSASWMDLDGNMWMFGGTGWNAANLNLLSDLWKYNPVTGEWTWMKGPALVNQPGNYGTIGIPAAANNPGGRVNNIWWRDIHSTFWLFGGEGIDGSNNPINHMNDLWKYIPPCNPDSIQSNPGLNICTGTPVTLTAFNQYSASVIWYNSATSNIGITTGSIYTSPPLTAVSSQSIYSYYAASNACTLTPRTIISITVNPLPNITITGPSTACAGSSVTFSVNGASSYTWNTGTTGSSITVTTSTSPFTCIVIGDDVNGCENSTTTVLTVLPAPSLTVVGSHSLICKGETATITASGATTFSWSTNQTSSTCTINPSQTSTYTVTGTDANGCEAKTTYTQAVHICTGISESILSEISCQLFPNPNKGAFTLQLQAQVETAKLILLNTMGQIVFEQNNLIELNIITTQLPPGIYYFYIQSAGTRLINGKLSIE